MGARAARLAAERAGRAARSPRVGAPRWRAHSACLALCALACAALILALSGRARAHQVGLSRGDYLIQGATVAVELTFAQRELAGLVPELDRDRSDALSDAELTAGREAVARAVVERLVVESDGVACPGQLASAQVVENDGVTVRATYTCAAAPGEARFDLALLDDLPVGHRHIFRGGAAPKLTEAILFRKRRSIEVIPQPAPAASGAASPARAEGAEGAEGAAGTAPAAPAAPAAPSGALDLFAMGVEHILLGFDHLVFLLGLVIVGGRWRSILLVVTAFTLAHSITLGLSTLEVVALSPRIVEPAIALSIAYVGVENHFVKDAEGRWRITLPFGLIHGFGFAGALQEIALPRAEVPKALLFFNLGVEAGQLAVLALVLPLLALARKRGWFTPRAVKAASVLIIIAGVGWFLERILG